MESSLKKGAILKLYEDDDKKYIIIENIRYDNQTYIILNPFYDDKDVQNININDMLIIRLKENFDFEYVDDENLVKLIIKQVLN